MSCTVLHTRGWWKFSLADIKKIFCRSDRWSKSSYVLVVAAWNVFPILSLLRTRKVFKTVAGNKGYEFIGQKQTGDFVIFSGLLKKTQTLKTFKIFETLSSSPMPSSTDLLSINMLAKASKYLSIYCKEFESDRNLEENKTPSSFSDIYVPKFWVDLIFNSMVNPWLFLVSELSEKFRVKSVSVSKKEKV